MYQSHTTPALPCVRWGSHEISRLLIGHNPFKGQAHFSRALDAEMKAWYAPELGHDLDILTRCEEAGINTAQFGGAVMHALLRRHAERGGRLQWIATFYDAADDPETEIQAILAVEPPPIGIYYYGGALDTCFLSGQLERVAERLRRLRDTGLLVGVGSHLPEAMCEVESRGWDADFYETCLYTVYADRRSGTIDRDNEVFDDRDRDAMLAFVKQVSKPCIVFKTLAASRKCSTDDETRAALAYAYRSIKSSDVVLVGMWQKYKDQITQNAQWAGEILSKIEADQPQFPS